MIIHVHSYGETTILWLHHSGIWKMINACKRRIFTSAYILSKLCHSISNCIIAGPSVSDCVIRLYHVHEVSVLIQHMLSWFQAHTLVILWESSLWVPPPILVIETAAFGRVKIKLEWWEKCRRVIVCPKHHCGGGVYLNIRIAFLAPVVHWQLLGCLQMICAIWLFLTPGFNGDVIPIHSTSCLHATTSWYSSCF